MTPLLSILIPVYNWDARPLLAALLEEIGSARLERDVNLLVMDDRSSDAEMRGRNARFAATYRGDFFTYVPLEENLGRAGVRNQLASARGGEYLLFLDCDTLPDSDHFIRAYLERLAQDPADVICGGVSYQTRLRAERAYDFHAYFGRRKETRTAEQRNRAPGKHLLTSNVLVRRDVFCVTPFNEEFRGYGYEDIEWGMRLAKERRILHINNSVSHLGLCARPDMYRKMRASIANYLLLARLYPEAVARAGVVRAADLFAALPPWLPRRLEAGLRWLFLRERLDCRLAFVAFQLCHAMLLALARSGEEL